MRVIYLVAIMSMVFAIAAAAAQKEGKEGKAKGDKGKKEAKAQGSDAGEAGLYPQPTEIHKEMVKADQGVWDATMKAYFAGPNQPPSEFKGIETVRSMADGMFLVSDFEADFVGGKKFKGHGISGYDTQKKKLVGVWADNMGTGIGTLEGDYVPNSKTVTMWFESLDPMTGKMRKDKHVTEYKAEGHKVYTIFMAMGGGNEQVKLMEIESKRRKDASANKAEAKDVKAKEAK
jgi:hypothetical protein